MYKVYEVINFHISIKYEVIQVKNLKKKIIFKNIFFFFFFIKTKTSLKNEKNNPRKYNFLNFHECVSILLSI